MTEQEQQTELETWVEVFQAFQEDKKKLAAFEKHMCAYVRKSLDKLDDEIRAELKKIEKEGGGDWSSYLEDFDTWRWEDGGFQQTIADYVKDQIAHALTKR